jgi:hypothetical protein
MNFLYPNTINFCTSVVVNSEQDTLDKAVSKFLADRYTRARAPRFISPISLTTSEQDDKQQRRIADMMQCQEFNVIRLYEHIGFVFGYLPKSKTAEVTLDKTVLDTANDEQNAAIAIRCLGWNSARLKQYLAHVNERNETITDVWVTCTNIHSLYYWKTINSLMSRPIDTVEMDPNLKCTVVNDTKGSLILPPKDTAKCKELLIVEGSCFMDLQEEESHHSSKLWQAIFI